MPTYAQEGYGAKARADDPFHNRVCSMKAKNRFESLIHTVCVCHGYCGGMHGDKFMHVTDLIPRSGYVTPDQFVEWVFLAEYENESERMAPRWDRHRQKIRDCFVEHMGSDVVDAGQLKYGV
ncbi:hypothetical protein AB4037_34100 [Labrys sp. KB_33_2]|uniref:hypothetical protein n=1 Tax=Labrys sp. KB_33_2 TaxID=3237479 RepID=UPI003F903838